MGRSASFVFFVRIVSLHAGRAGAFFVFRFLHIECSRRQELVGESDASKKKTATLDRITSYGRIFFNSWSQILFLSSRRRRRRRHPPLTGLGWCLICLKKVSRQEFRLLSPVIYLLERSNPIVEMRWLFVSISPPEGPRTSWKNNRTVHRPST